ncbi:MAG: Fe-S-cluster-containing dehydrogenase component [Candidatus Methanohalarchaeum thermophilum]|uniref:Fe-S-cluster-containing dehydrogenase component n=1 Tax=Methanohalarchaeum thermophilum TaxID=1903181 RepID=A0A1Q6DWB5_METT1|nr:MAG: Fe-S-cluster-containing dehydrogenase component [Candidatus Methanohalarchaeum thermophilum]
MADVRYKFGFDQDRCIDCGGCEIACKRENDVPPGVFRRKVVTLNEGEPNEAYVSLACMHCTDAPCIPACPVDALSQRDDGIVLVDKDKCIGCGYCLWACPFGAPQFPKSGKFGSKGPMDKCDYCVDRIDEGKRPACEQCPTEALLAGDASEISRKIRERIGTEMDGGYVSP